MTKEQFMDQVVISMMGNSNNQMLITDRGSVEYWEFAESVWNTRPKKEKSVRTPKAELFKEEKEIYWQQFWEVYDKKVGTAKAKAKFLTIPAKEMWAVVQSAEAYAQSTPEVKFRKHPVTWLNQECWLDSEPKDGKSKSQISFV